MIYQTSDPLKEDLADYIDELPSFLTIQKDASDTPQTNLWSITAPVNAAHGKDPGFLAATLGLPKDFSRWFAVTRLWSPWIAPRQGKDKFQPDKEAILTAFERNDGTHLVVLAISGVDDVLTILTHNGEGRIVVKSQNDREQDGIIRLVAAIGMDLESAVASTMYYARKVVTQYQEATGEADAEYQALVDGFKPEWLENWCKWHKRF